MSDLLFGTGYPFWAPQATIDALAGLKLDPADLSAIERDKCAKAAAEFSSTSIQ